VPDADANGIRVYYEEHGGGREIDRDSACSCAR
jgi:hypothetical protein